ncbi:hypothetical protein AB6A40_005816 [Gnathostoma spinigerum]|uniref:Uncharacterized protein n=1 Tax=Gnathostoma spinigerum TaxID=75299 RepID=A0ABD6EIR6_9BILA
MSIYDRKPSNKAKNTSFDFISEKSSRARILIGGECEFELAHRIRIIIVYSNTTFNAGYPIFHAIAKDHASCGPLSIVQSSRIRYKRTMDRLDFQFRRLCRSSISRPEINGREAVEFRQ